jgi:hypothetical protein
MMPFQTRKWPIIVALSILIPLAAGNSVQAQISEVWTETTEEDFATGLGVDTVKVSIRSSPGDIVLTSASEENLALDKNVDDGDDGTAPEKVLDGDLSTFWITKSTQPLGVSITIDLEAQRLIEQIHILGYRDLFRIRGYRISLSLDQSRWETVAENPDNASLDALEIIDATVARYIRVTIITIDEIHAVAISEIQVFGAGYSPSGTYFSEAKDFGTPTNFGKARWAEELPDVGMDITLQFRSDSAQVVDEEIVLTAIDTVTSLANGSIIPGSELVTDENGLFEYFRGYDYDIDYQAGSIWRLETSTIDSGATVLVDYALWGGWSAEYSNPEGSLFQIPEPRQFLQYRANLTTNTINTPRLQEISIAYSSTPVVQKAFGAVRPTEVPIMQESTVSYLFHLIYGSNILGVDTAVISTPSPARVQEVRLDGITLGDSEYDDITTRDRIKIAFAQTIMADSVASLEIDFATTLFLSENSYPSWIVSTITPDNPQYAEQDTTTWTVTTTGIPAGPLISVEAKPNPFSPNGDGLFDETIISYFVAKIAYPQPTSIKIYDLNGNIVRTLRDQMDPAFFYEIAWNGRNDAGELVPPGLYIYQVRVKTDAGEEVTTKTVTVQY